MKDKGLLREQLALGELPNQAKLPWNDQECEDIKKEINDSNLSILNNYPPELMLARFKKAAEQGLDPKEVPIAPSQKKPFWGRSPVITWSSLAAAALFAVFLLPWSFFQTQDNQERLKGGDPRFSVYLQTATEPQKLREGDRVQENDRLQISLTVFKKTNGALFSLDGRGMVTIHYPPKGTISEPLEPGETFLPYSYILDDAPDFERFYFVTADIPFEIPRVTAEIKAGKLISSDKNLSVSRLSLKKGH